MTQTLTTERLREIVEDGFLEHGDAKAMAAELLANREARPVFFIEIEGDDWINAGRVPGSKFDFNNLPDGINYLYTAPPSPAFPSPISFSENADADMCRKWAWDQVKEQVSTDGWTLGDNITYFGFFCWGWDMRRQYNEQRPPAPAVQSIVDWRLDESTGAKILMYKDCSVIEDQQAEYVLSLIKAAAPEGGNEK